MLLGVVYASPNPSLELGHLKTGFNDLPPLPPNRLYSQRVEHFENLATSAVFIEKSRNFDWNCLGVGDLSEGFTQPPYFFLRVGLNELNNPCRLQKS